MFKAAAQNKRLHALAGVCCCFSDLLPVLFRQPKHYIVARRLVPFDGGLLGFSAHFITPQSIIPIARE